MKLKRKLQAIISYSCPTLNFVLYFFFLLLNSLKKFCNSPSKAPYYRIYIYIYISILGNSNELNVIVIIGGAVLSP
jgi:hypothetical protein